MHIALVSPYDPFPERGLDADGHVGGVERVFAEIAVRLRRRGHDVSVACSSPEPGRSTHRGVEVVRAPRTGTFMRTPLANVSRAIPDDADIVQVAATYPFTTPAAIHFARRHGIPCALDFHFEPDPATPLGRLAARAYRFVGPRSYPLADQVLVRSHDYGRSARSLDGVPSNKWRAVPNGIDPQRFRPDGPKRGEGNLLFVGRLVPYKGLDVLLHALAGMRRPPPLWVAGDGPLRASLERSARRLGVEARFLGPVPDDALPPLYRGARLTVLPSVGQQECFGITLLESMACGTPVVASDLPGVRAVARRGGRTAASGDPHDWRRALQAALDDTMQPRGVPLARRIHATCSWDAVTQRLESIYASMTDTRENHEDTRRHAVLRA